MTAAVSLSDIAFRYGKKEVLNFTKLEIVSGEKVFIHGPSGSGKSTLLNLICGILSPSQGSVVIGGKELNDFSPSKKDQFRGGHIGLIFQSFNLIPYLTVKENVLLPIKTSNKRKQNLKKSFEEDFADLISGLNLSGLEDQYANELSIGQKQRVAVARALIGSPEIIIADEPTSALDDDVTDQFMQLLLKEYEKQKFTLIFVSHDKRLRKFFDREIDLLSINQTAAINA